MKHVTSLDGIRGVAVAAVVLYHFNSLLNVSPNRNLPMLLFGRLFRGGWLGVDIFFVLSGFLITSIILNERDDKNFWSTFYLRRSLRILPAFLVVFITTLLMVHWLMPGLVIAKSYVIMTTFFMANWTIVTKTELPVLGHLWSLAVEEQFYFLWPQAVKRLSASTVLYLSITIAVFSGSLRIGLALLHLNPFVIYKITPTSLDGLAIGGALAAGMSVVGVRKFLARRWSTIAWAATFGLVVIFAIFRGGIFLFDLRCQAVAIPTVAVLVAMLIFASVAGALPPVLGAFFGSPIMTWLGRRSYGLYLIHEPIRYAVEESRIHGTLRQLRSGSLVNVLLVLLSIAVALLLTELSWRLVESPARRLRRSLVKKREPADVTSK